MLLFGRSRSRRGLASALIGEIAAVIDGMEGFEEIRKLEDMEIGAEDHLDELGAFTLPKFSVYESNADRLDLFDAAIQHWFIKSGALTLAGDMLKLPRLAAIDIENANPPVSAATRHYVSTLSGNTAASSASSVAGSLLSRRP